MDNVFTRKKEVHICMIKEKIINKVKKGSKKAAISMARYYDNVAYPMVVYQPYQLNFQIYVLSIWSYLEE